MKKQMSVKCKAQQRGCVCGAVALAIIVIALIALSVESCMNQNAESAQDSATTEQVTE